MRGEADLTDGKWVVNPDLVDAYTSHGPELIVEIERLFNEHGMPSIDTLEPLPSSEPGEMSIADRVYGLEEAVSELGDEPFEWLKLPWGGVWRKSNVVGAGTAGVSVMVENAHGEGIRGDADDEEQAKAWLADIERQIGVKR